MLRACCRSFHCSELTKHTPFQQQQQVTQAPTGNWLFVDKLNLTQVVTALICSSIHHNILISPAQSSDHLTGRGKASLAPGNSAIHTITTVDSTAITACIQAATLKAPRGSLESSLAETCSSGPFSPICLPFYHPFLASFSLPHQLVWHFFCTPITFHVWPIK